MAAPSSSVGVNLYGCSSDPHTPRNGQTNYASLQAQRLSSVRPNNENFTDRLVDRRPYDHQANMGERLSRISSQIGSTGAYGSNTRK